MVKSIGWLRMAMALAVLCVAMPAQETVEGRLLKILKEKGVIDSAEYKDLRDLEAQLRRDDNVAALIDTRIEEMISSVQEAGPSTSYQVGKGFTWQTADNRFKLSVGGRLQVRFTNDFYEDDENEPDFDVPRARVWLTGNAFESYLKYKFEFDIAGDEADTTLPNGSTRSSNNRLAELKDAYFDFAKWSAFSVRGGQFKVPYSRHQLTSSGRQEFVDRGITDGVFAPGRDVGVMVHGKAGGESSDLFEYYFGAFDGEGENRTNNDHGLMYAGRLAVNPLGGVAYTESDTAHSDNFRLALAVNGWVHQDGNHAGAGDDWSIGADIAVFYQSFFAMFELHYRENDVNGGDDVEMDGWIAQLGYFIVPHEFEVALRAASIDWDNNGNNDSGRREYLVVFGYFWHSHNMKMQLDFGRVEDHEGNQNDNVDEWRLRVQFQVIF